MYINKLNSPQVQQDLSDTLTKNLQQLTQDISDPDAAWVAFRNAVYSTGEDVLGHHKENTRIGLMKTTRRFLTSWQGKEQSMQPG